MEFFILGKCRFMQTWSRGFGCYNSSAGAGCTPFALTLDAFTFLFLRFKSLVRRRCNRLGFPFLKFLWFREFHGAKDRRPFQNNAFGG